MGLEQPAVPITSLRPLVTRHMEREGISNRAFANACGVHSDTISQIVVGANSRNQPKKYVNFSIADKIITNGFRNPLLWWTNAKLRKVYEKGIPINDQDRLIMDEGREKVKMPCSLCRRKKVYTEFWVNNSAPRGRDYQCKDCRNAKKKESRAARSVL